MDGIAVPIGRWIERWMGAHPRRHPTGEHECPHGFATVRECPTCAHFGKIREQNLRDAMDEHDIHHAFTKGDMFYAEAVLRLQKLGYDAKEADQIVSEWADGAEAERMASDGAEEEYR